jgi:hypothetical protein
MKNSIIGKLFYAAFYFILVASATGIYAQGGVKTVNLGDAIKLEYNYPSDKPVSYLNVNKITQLLDFQGQSMEVNVASAFGCTVKSSGKDGSNLKLAITIDTLTQSIDSPQGSAGGAISAVQGKSFNVIIAPQGKEIDMSECEKVTFSMDGSAETNISQYFSDFFPDMPAGMVKPGDTWSTSDSVNTKTPSSSSKVLINSINKFDGIEILDGVECAKISSVFNGTQLMKSQTQGMDIVSKGPVTGSATLFFAIKEGYFVKQVSNSKMTGTVDISGANEMSFPVVMDIISTNEIVK